MADTTTVEESPMTSQLSAEPARPSNVPADRVVDFDMYNPPGIEKGLQEAWAALQNGHPADLVWTPHNGGHWIPLDGEMIRDVSNRHEVFSNRINFLPKEAGGHGFIPATLDPPEHQPYRKILNGAFGRGAIRPLEATIRQRADDLVDSLADRGSCDFVADYAGIFPVQVFLALIDLPVEDSESLKYIADQMTRPDGSMTLAEATEKYFDYLRPVIERRMNEPGEDALSRVVSGQIDGRPLTVEECLKIAGLLLLAGLDTVVNLLGFIMQHLAENEDLRRLLAAHPDRTPAVTEELLRRFGPVIDARLLKADVELDGVTLREGDMIARPTLLYGLDPKIHGCPMDVDPDRESTDHLLFGYGVHHCVGAHLARVEIQATITAWLARLPDVRVREGATIRHQSGVVGAIESLPLTWTTG
jgi:camphor 5-monooxygenase